MSNNVVAIQLKHTQSVVWGVLKESLNPNVIILENPAYIINVPPSNQNPQGGFVFHSVFDTCGISIEETEMSFDLNDITSRRYFKTNEELAKGYLQQFEYTVLELPDTKIQF